MLPKTIIVVNDHGIVTGGAAQVAIASLNSLADAGYRVIFISAAGPVDSSIDRDRVEVINFGFYDLLSNPSKVNAAISGIWNSRAAVRFENVLSKHAPQDTIIHLHTWTKSLSASVINVALKRGFKLVCTLHDYFSVCPNGGLYNYQTSKLCDLRPMSFSCLLTNCDSRSYGQKLWRFIRQVVQDKYGRMPTGVHNYISVTDYSEALIKPFIPQGSSFFRVNNPINIEKTTSSSVSLNETFTFIGRLTPEKGATIFAKAACIADVKAVFIGSGSDDNEIRTINPNAELCGWQDHAGVTKAIRSSRAIVFPSLWHETQGLVVSEAAALGVPAIVSDACAAKDSIVDGVNGLLFRSGDPEDLASKLCLLNSDQQLTEALGTTAYDQYWAMPCTLDNHVKELISCYTEIMNGAN